MRRNVVVLAVALACLVPSSAAVAASPTPTVAGALSPSSAVTAGTSRVYTAAFVISRMTSVSYSVGLPAGFSKPAAVQLPLPTGCQKSSGPAVAAVGSGWSITGTLTCKKLALFALAFKTSSTVAGQAELPWSVTSSTDPGVGRSGSFGLTVKPAAVASVSLAASNAGLPANGTSQARLVAVPLDAYGNLVTGQLQPQVSFAPAATAANKAPKVSGFLPGAASNLLGTYVASYTASTSPGVATIRVKATAGGHSVTSAPVTLTQVPRFSVRTDGEILTFFDTGSFRPGAPALKGARAQGIHLVWTAPQDINLAGAPFPEDLVLTLPFGKADFTGPGNPDRYAVWNGTQIGGSCDIPGDDPPPWDWGETTSTVTFEALACHAGETLVLDLVSIGFPAPRTFSAELDLQEIPVATSPIDVVDSATVTPKGPTHYLEVGDPQPVAGEPQSATVAVTLRRPNGTVDTTSTTQVEFVLGRCGEAGPFGGWQAQPLSLGRTTFTLTLPDATWVEQEAVYDADGNPVYDENDQPVYITTVHPLYSTDNWYFRTTDASSLLAHKQVTLGDPQAAHALEVDGSSTSPLPIPPNYICPGSSKW